MAIKREGRKLFEYQLEATPRNPDTGWDEWKKNEITVIVRGIGTKNAFIKNEIVEFLIHSDALDFETRGTDIAAVRAEFEEMVAQTMTAELTEYKQVTITPGNLTSKSFAMVRGVQIGKTADGVKVLQYENVRDKIWMPLQYGEIKTGKIETIEPGYNPEKHTIVQFRYLVAPDFNVEELIESLRNRIRDALRSAQDLFGEVLDRDGMDGLAKVAAGGLLRSGDD